MEWIKWIWPAYVQPEFKCLYKKNILKIYTRVSMTLKLFFLLFFSSTFELFHSNSSYRRLWMFFFIFQMRFLWCTTHMCIFVVFMSLTSFYLYATKKSCWLTGEIKKEHIKLMLINFFRLMDIHIFYKVTWNVIGWINHGKKNQLQNYKNSSFHFACSMKLFSFYFFCCFSSLSCAFK